MDTQTHQKELDLIKESVLQIVPAEAIYRLVLTPTVRLAKKATLIFTWLCQMTLRACRNCKEIYGGFFGKEKPLN